MVVKGLRQLRVVRGVQRAHEILHRTKQQRRVFQICFFQSLRAGGSGGSGGVGGVGGGVEGGGRKECIYELESVVGMSSQIVIIFVGLRVVRSPTVSQSYVLRLDFTKFDTVHFLY